MTSIVLYDAPQSTCSQRVRFALHAKGVPFVEEKLDLFSGDQLKPDYLAINPNGVVPSLVHDGRTVTDSSVIIEYLDEVFPTEPHLVPSDAAERAHMRAMMRYIDEVPAAAIRIPSYNLAFLRHYQQMSEAEFLELADSKPLRRDFLLKMGRKGFPAAEMNNSMSRLDATLVRMNRWIGERGGPWLLGGQISLADIAIMPVIVRLDDIGQSRMWIGLPKIAIWLAAIRAHPAYEPTYYFGSLLTEKYPNLKNEMANP